MTSADFAAVPPTLRGATPPLVMLAMSRDHQLYVKAYTDYSDLDGNGALDTTYTDNFDYYGYFSSNLCYDYSDGMFVPKEAASGTNKHECGTAAGRWSGNFLNWATMTRMDVVRAVLFGGARVSGFDTATSSASQGETVLERVFLPADNHAFVKVYAGPDIARFTPYAPTSNRISLCNTNLSTTGNPLLRIAEGAWQQWSSSEVAQCRFSDEGGSTADQPAYASRPAGLTGDLTVRVKVCVPGLDAVGANNRCKAYTDPATGNVTYKPVGILQQYGDDGRIRFGLLTGSYGKKTSGGVLRKDILPLAGNVVASDNEIDTTNGRFINQGASDGGIINTLTRFRIVSYDFSSHKYSDCNTHSISISTFLTSTDANRQCSSWGNPLSEIYLEALRYFAGATAGTPAFDASDSGIISSLPQLATWKNPLTADNKCANCSIVVISTGLNSFDTDELASVTDLGTTLTALRAKTDSIGTHEGIDGKSFLIGRNGSTDDDRCTAKTLGHLSNAKGICPELPGLEGGYDIAGLAYHAFTTDLRTDLEGIQKVSTYSVALAESLPSFEIDVNGKTVSFVPTCQANTTSGAKLTAGGWTDCSLVDVRVERQTTTSGSFLVAWEDSQWGNDYDMDGIARIEYCVGSSGCPSTPANSPAAFTDYEWKTGLSGDSIQFRISVPQAAAGNALRFGYVISGVATTSAVDRKTNALNVTDSKISVTPQNGLQVHLLRQGGKTINRLSGTTGTDIFYVEPVVYTASSLTTAGSLLENPLWYTAKYGNFNDTDGDKKPGTDEWDIADINGSSRAEGGAADGIPDNYFPVRNPANLAHSLGRIMQTISSKVASSTAAAVVANSSRGSGAIYQAVYYPQFQTRSGEGEITDRVDWVGELHALFVDDNSVIREDNGIKGQLEEMATDFGVDIYYDEKQALTLIQRYKDVPFTEANKVGDPEPFEKLQPVWSARNRLAALTDTQLASQRTYADGADTGRYIFTWIDRDKDGVVDDGGSGSELVDFVSTGFPVESSGPIASGLTKDDYRYLAMTDSSRIAALVNYVRGIEVAGSRSRSIDYDSSGTAKTWRLGDIINSSPVLVGAPSADYDRRFGDSTYLAYKQHYRDRRQVAYVGSNDGMLHAFNAGKWKSSTRSLDSAGQPLGGELWAYVPMNLLPHLQWLKEPNYPHVFYVDGALKSFDVNIFANDATHPGGWGTILVAGMRFGGGNFPVDSDGDGIVDTTTRSAYIVFDVTDPDKPPQLLAEIAHPSLGFTVGAPEIIKRRVPDRGSFTGTSRNEWLLVFGSGPTVLSSATSTQESRVFAWSFADKKLVPLNANVTSGFAESTSFVGSFKAVDWNNDFVDDVVYAGTVGGTVSAPTGTLKRVRLDGEDANLGLGASGGATAGTFFDPGRPVFSTPNPYLDTTSGDSWVFFGTGRYLVPADSQSIERQAFYGIKEPKSGSTLTYAQVTDKIQDVTDVHVSTKGEVSNGSGGSFMVDGVAVTRFDALRRAIATRNGWVRYLTTPGSEGAERAFTDSTFYYGTVLFTTYQPDADLCTAAGDGALYALSLFTGSAAAFQPVGIEKKSTRFSNHEAAASVSLGRTLPSGAVVLSGRGRKTAESDDPGESNTGNCEGGTFLVQGSNGQMILTCGGQPPPTSGRQSWREIELNFGI